MKERLGFQFNPIGEQNVYRGEEYPQNYKFLDVEPEEGQIIGYAVGEHVDQVLVWDQGTVIGMSRERYERGTTL